MSVLIALLGLSFIVMMHELGHFIAARHTKTAVLQFKVFFGKSLFSKRIGDTLFELGWIPLGGYIRPLQGGSVSSAKEELKKVFGDDYPKHLARPRYWSHYKSGMQQIYLAAAGPVASFLTATALFLVTDQLYGTYAIHPDGGCVVTNIFPGSAMEKAGIKENDILLTANGVKLSPELFAQKKVINQNGDVIMLEVLRGDRIEMIPVTPQRASDDQPYMLGFMPDRRTELKQLGVTGSIAYSLEYCRFITAGTFQAVSRVLILDKQARQGIGGPVSIVKAMMPNDLHSFLVKMAFISIALGAINLFPLFPADGARILVGLMACFALNSRMQFVVEGYKLVSMLMMMCLGIYVIGKDIWMLVTDILG